MENEHGSNHFFNVLEITPLQDLIESKKSLKMPFWDYNGKSHLIRELPNERVFKKDIPYIVD